jgi:hypothetical protein
MEHNWPFSNRAARSGLVRDHPTSADCLALAYSEIHRGVFVLTSPINNTNSGANSIGLTKTGINTLQLPAGLAGVTISGAASGVYNPATGVVTLSGDVGSLPIIVGLLLGRTSGGDLRSGRGNGGARSRTSPERLRRSPLRVGNYLPLTACPKSIRISCKGSSRARVCQDSSAD